MSAEEVLLLAGNMEQDELFVMQSDTEAEESASVSSVFQDSRISFKRNKVNRNHFTSSEMSSSNSYTTSMDSSRSGSYVAMSPDPRQHTSLGGISKLKGITKSTSRLLHYKTAPAFDVENSSNELLDNPNHEESVSTLLSYSDRSNDGLGGYESGEAEKRINKGYLCKECKHLHKKTSRARQAARQIPKKPDPSHWASKFWMMINRIPSQKKNTRMKKKKHRALKSIVRKLQSRKPATKHHLQCLRIHSFLRRNLKLCVKTKKLLNTPKGRHKRKRTSSVQKSESKKRKKPVNSSYNDSSSKKNITFVWDSSDEDNSALTIKRYNVKVLESKMKNVQGPSIVSSTVCSPGLQATTQEEDGLSPSRQSPHSDPQDCTSDGSTSSPFAHVQRGSFRELLEILNSGYLRTGIINENKI